MRYVMQSLHKVQIKDQHIDLNLNCQSVIMSSLAMKYVYIHGGPTPSTVKYETTSVTANLDARLSETFLASDLSKIQFLPFWFLPF